MRQRCVIKAIDDVNKLISAQPYMRSSEVLIYLCYLLLFYPYGIIKAIINHLNLRWSQKNNLGSNIFFHEQLELANCNYPKKLAVNNEMRFLLKMAFLLRLIFVSMT